MSDTEPTSAGAEAAPFDPEASASPAFVSAAPSSPVTPPVAPPTDPYAPDARAQEILTFVVMLASLFGGRTWKTIAALASSALNGTLPEAALADLEALIAKHGLRL